jgi:hypothetical protein
MGTGNGQDARQPDIARHDARPPESVRLAVRVPPALPKDVFHLVLQLQFLLLQGDFFEVFWL